MGKKLKILLSGPIMIAALISILLTGCTGLGSVEEATEKAREAAEKAQEAAASVASELEDAAASLPQQTADQPAGYQPHAPLPEDAQGPPVSDHFGGQKPYVYRQVDAFRVICESGDCPDSKQGGHMTNEDWLDIEQSTELFEDQVRLHISTLHYVDTMANCTEKDSFSYPYELTIESKTADTIVAKGMGGGSHSRGGSGCADGEYKYRYETDETWIFTTVNLADKVTVDVTTDAPGNIINAPGWKNPQSSPPYSEHSLIVKCTDSQGFQVQPTYKVVKVNGYEATASLQHRYEEISDTESRFRFGAFYDAEYTVVGYCRVYGKNGALLGEATDGQEFKIIVTGSSQGALPEDHYKQ